LIVSEQSWQGVRRALLALVAALALVACGDDEHAPSSEIIEAPARGAGGTSADDDVPSEPPEPTESDAPCIIGADCPAGTHCDLGECVQLCSTDEPCAGDRVCSPRGRCIEPSTRDRDPAPVTTHAGSLRADPIAAELSELDTELVVWLRSDARELVQYRVESRAAFLRLDGVERGEFSGETALRFVVDTSEREGTLSAGTVAVHSSLGSVILRPTLRVGLSGRYQGVLRYSSDTTPLGDVGIVVDMLDDNGDVLVKVDPERSMTFPAVQGAPATGRGIFTFSEGLSVSVAQVFEEEFGGERNHFQRDIGRRIALELRPVGRGRLEGRFDETLHGILEQPIGLSGNVYLEPVATDQTPAIELLPPPNMPQGVAALPSASTFPGWSESSCLDPACPASNDAATLDCIRDAIEPTYYEPLLASLSAASTMADPFGPIASDCQSELGTATIADYRAAQRRCALLPPLACSLKLVAREAWPTGLFDEAQVTFNRLYARVLVPPLLVAQNHIVQGLRDSFTAGVAVQADRLRQARSVLGAPARFLLASGMLEYLRTLPAAVAAGDDSSEDSTQTNFPAGRALARLVYVLHSLDAEQARAEATTLLGPRAEKLVPAQERGVLGFFEAAALAAVLERWDNPPNLGNEFLGSLTLADRGFTGLEQGALVFGVPEGEVPLVFDPARSQPTNFEQVLELRARPALDQLVDEQAAFEGAGRQFEQSAALLQSELEGVRRGYEDQIGALCGADFAFATLESDADWAACGASGGELAELTLEIEQRLLRLQASQARIEGMRQKYIIDQQRLADTLRIQTRLIVFTDATGDALEGLVVQEGIVNAAQQALSIGAQSSILNGGAPLAMAAAAALLEGMRTQINVARQRLQTLQEVRALGAERDITFANGMAELKKQLIDSAQLELELQQDALAIVQADLGRRGALDRARRLFAERARALGRIAQSPLQDPSYRVLEDRLALQVVRSRAEAQRWLYRAGRALEYETNTPLGAALPRAVLSAYNSAEVERLSRCLSSIYAEYTALFGVPQEFTTTLSVREMLGFSESRTDRVTGAELSAGELFRQSVLRNEYIEENGDLVVTFPTNLQPGNELWSSNVCDDKIARVQAQLVGDFQGDNEAEVQVVLEGGSVLRRCDSDELIGWDLRSPGRAVVQAGVNTFGDVSPNSSLAGQSVARASWRIIVPSGNTAPANADLNLERLDDIVLRITHEALPRREQAIPLDVSCLGSVGAGG
jgi:hypothetical protein